ncbi:MAG: MBL fold metallo-hydrolase [Actinobacteria bacterium]|jgi:flavorubredoxin|nr:MBL fold metallo-hydrolase [Actinomycetota bacterium]MCL6094598.1 MBL fold metallo-hydrolase [Actinomycetota bacterium]
MINEVLFDNGVRRWQFIGRDADRPSELIDTNEYLVTNNGKGLIPDPGGMEIFPAVVTAISEEFAVDNVEVLFASHQDPDVFSSLGLWVKVCPGAAVWLSRIWEKFMSHFSFGTKFHLIPDEGGVLPLGGSNDLQIIPAHYLHSSGNFSIYDPQAKILWSGDIGAALLPPDHSGVFVSDFYEHTKYMEGFHRRWMPSPQARDAWIARVSRLEIDMICPQHGAIIRGEDVHRFFQWFSELELASALHI